MNFLQELETVLKGDERFVSQDGQLLKPRVQDAVNQLDAQLIRQLIAAPVLREHFFKKVDGITIFDHEKFMWVVNSKEFLPDSYTSYRNKIGLSANDHDLLTSSNEVSLVWPYKDCVLEGGQDKEDETRDEIFYNETLAPDEVGRLLAPKAFSNATRYTAEGEEHVTAFDKNDNLIIKGNNLFGISSLLPRYKGAIKFIYIDPPFNTGEDSFRYNDRFSRSTWLTFMKNRIELAKDLLTDDGVFAFQISFHEGSYLDVMLDDIKGLHRVMAFHVLVRHPDRILTSDKTFNDVVEMVLIYSKSPDFQMPKREKKKDLNEYIWSVETSGTPRLEKMGGKTVEVFLPEQWTRRRVEPSEKALKIHSIRGSLREKNSSGRFYVANIEPNAENYAPMTLFRVPGMGDDELGYRYFFTPKEGNKNGSYFQGVPQSSAVTYAPYPNFLDMVEEYNRVSAQGGVVFRNGKKPEQLLEFLLSLFTKRDDIVLDYHLGSGTTAATALKMGRKALGVEQMDYVADVTVPRLKNVITGDSTGISDAVSCSGGDSFVYVELAEQSEKLMRELQDAATTDEVQGVLDQATERGLLRPSVLPDQLADSALEFAQLSLDEQKRAVAELIDKNRLYINASDAEDAELGLSEADIAFTKSFYQKGER